MPGGRARTSNKIIRRPRSVYVQVKAHGGIQKKRLECLLYVCCSYVCGCLFFYPPTHTFFGSSRHVTHLAYTWTCVCNEPEIKVRQHSREDIKVIYDPGRCYENLPFYFFFYFLFSKNPRLCTLDPRHVTLDFVPSTLDQNPDSKKVVCDIARRLDYQPLFGKMSPHSRPDPGDGRNRAYVARG